MPTTNDTAYCATLSTAGQPAPFTVLFFRDSSGIRMIFEELHVQCFSFPLVPPPEQWLFKGLYPEAVDDGTNGKDGSNGQSAAELWCDAHLMKNNTVAMRLSPAKMTRAYDKIKGIA